MRLQIRLRTMIAILLLANLLVFGSWVVYRQNAITRKLQAIEALDVERLLVELVDEKLQIQHVSLHGNEELQRFLEYQQQWGLEDASVISMGLIDVDFTLSSSLLTELSSVNVEEMYFTNCKFERAVPDYFGRAATHAVVLETEFDASAFDSFTELNELSISTCRIPDGLFERLAKNNRQLSSLKIETLEADTTLELTESVIQNIAKLPELSEVTFIGCHAQENSLIYLKNARKLKSLQLVKAHVSDQHCQDISQVGSLTALNLTKNEITVGGLELLMPLTELRLIGLKENPLGDEERAKELLEQFKKLNEIYFDHPELLVDREDGWSFDMEFFAFKDPLPASEVIPALSSRKFRRDRFSGRR